MWTYALALISAVLGGWMLADGLRVLRTGRYFGPETPGPWRHVPQAFGVDPFAPGNAQEKTAPAGRFCCCQAALARFSPDGP